MASPVGAGNITLSADVFYWPNGTAVNNYSVQVPPQNISSLASTLVISIPSSTLTPGLTYFADGQVTVTGSSPAGAQIFQQTYTTNLVQFTVPSQQTTTQPSVASASDAGLVIGVIALLLILLLLLLLLLWCLRRKKLLCFGAANGDQKPLLVLDNPDGFVSYWQRYYDNLLSYFTPIASVNDYRFVQVPRVSHFLRRLFKKHELHFG